MIIINLLISLLLMTTGGCDEKPLQTMRLGRVIVARREMDETLTTGVCQSSTGPGQAGRKQEVVIAASHVMDVYGWI